MGPRVKPEDDGEVGAGRWWKSRVLEHELIQVKHINIYLQRLLITGIMVPFLLDIR
jgi:hypothetical protein